MKAIDFHTHTFPEAIAERAVARFSAASHTKPFTDGTETGLRASMARADIGLSVILPVATNPKQVVKVNDASLRINERTKETGLLSFGCMHPDFEDWHGELGRLQKAGVRGIKLHPVYQGVDIDDPRFLRILDRSAELGLYVLIHAGLDVGFPGAEQAVPKKTANALKAVGPMPLILAHMGGWRCWDEAAQLLAGTGVYIDTSFSLGMMTPNGDGHYQTKDELRMMDGRTFVDQIRAFGAEKVLFGSDSPWADQKEVLEAFDRLPLTGEEKTLILHGNAEKLLGITA